MVHTIKELAVFGGVMRLNTFYNFEMKEFQPPISGSGEITSPALHQD